jgi:hypothetical protein
VTAAGDPARGRSPDVSKAASVGAHLEPGADGAQHLQAAAAGEPVRADFHPGLSGPDNRALECEPLHT